jgi:hypothetical protein
MTASSLRLVGFTIIAVLMAILIYITLSSRTSAPITASKPAATAEQMQRPAPLVPPAKVVPAPPPQVAAPSSPAPSAGEELLVPDTLQRGVSRIENTISSLRTESLGWTLQEWLTFGLLASVFVLVFAAILFKSRRFWFGAGVAVVAAAVFLILPPTHLEELLKNATGNPFAGLQDWAATWGWRGWTIFVLLLIALLAAWQKPSVAMAFLVIAAAIVLVPETIAADFVKAIKKAADEISIGTWQSLSVFLPVALAVILTVWAFVLLFQRQYKGAAGALVSAVAVLVLLPPLLGTGSFPSLFGSSVQTASTAYDQKCDRKIHQDVVITRGGRNINPNPHHCGVRWVVKSGAVEFPGNPFGTQHAGGQNGDTRTGTTSRVIATTETAVIDYQLCPGTYRSPGWC